MATNEPMTVERYQTIQAHAEIARSWRDTPDSYADVQIPLMAMILGADVLTLIAEVDRLRAREQALAAEIAAMRPVVEAVAKLESRETRENPIYSRDLVLHSDDINVLWLREQARAFVAAHQTVGEAAESGGECSIRPTGERETR